MQQWRFLLQILSEQSGSEWTTSSTSSQFKTKLKGWDLRTLENKKNFTFVCEYAGELISIKEAKTRAQELTHETGNYLIVLREHSSNDNQILRTHVDARFHGGTSIIHATLI